MNDTTGVMQERSTSGAADSASQRRVVGAFATVAGTLTALIGGAHMVAWLTGMMAQRGFSAITMKTNTSLCLLLLGVALVLLTAVQPGPVRRWAGRVCAAMALLIGTLTLSENLFGWNLGIDQLLAVEPPGAMGMVAPNRMGTPASISMVLAGTGLLLLARRRDPMMRTVQGLALAVCLVGMLSTIGYLYEVHWLYGAARFTAIAWPTALGLLVLGIGLLCARPAEGLMAQITASDAGGASIRRLLIPVLLLPVGLGWLRLAGERYGVFDAAMGTALVMLTFIVIFSLIVYYAGRSVSHSARALRESEERRNVVVAVQAERQRLNDVLELLPAYVVLLSPDYHVPFANRFFRERFGESHGKRCFEYLFNRSEPCEVCDTYRVLQTHAPHRWEWTGPDGRSYDVHDFPFTDADGSPLIMEMGIDITERKRAVEELQRTTQILRAISQHSPDLVFAKDSQGRLVYASESTLRVLGMSAEEALGKTDVEYHADPRLGEVVMDNDRIVRETRRPLVAEEPTRLPDGTLRVFHSTKVPWIADDGTLLGTFGIAVDITEHKQAEAALRELNETLEQRVAERTTALRQSEEGLQRANQTLERRVAERTAEAQRRTEQLQALAARLTQAEQKERQRLATILHDHLQQLLVGTKFHLGMVRNHPNDPELRQSLEQIDSLLDQSLETSRNLTVDLSPPILTHGNMAQVLHWLAEWMRSKHGLQVKLVADERVHPEAHEVRVLLFQAVRELLFNIVKHAKVVEATVELCRLDDQRVQVTVRDQGAGFEMSQQAHSSHDGSGFGLFAIRERLDWLNGTFRIDSKPGEGTCAVLVVPMALPSVAGQDVGQAAAGSWWAGDHKDREHRRE